MTNSFSLPLTLHTCFCKSVVPCHKVTFSWLITSLMAFSRWPPMTKTKVENMWLLSWNSILYNYFALFVRLELSLNTKFLSIFQNKGSYFTLFVRLKMSLNTKFLSIIQKRILQQGFYWLRKWILFSCDQHWPLLIFLWQNLDERKAWSWKFKVDFIQYVKNLQKQNIVVFMLKNANDYKYI